MYVLEKVRLLDGQNSMVGAGHRQSSDTLMVFLDGIHKAKEITDVNDIKVGWQVLVGRGMQFLQTSPVQFILERETQYIRFQTRTSIYELRETN